MTQYSTPHWRNHLSPREPPYLLDSTGLEGEPEEMSEEGREWGSLAQIDGQERQTYAQGKSFEYTWSRGS